MGVLRFYRNVTKTQLLLSSLFLSAGEVAGEVARALPEVRKQSTCDVCSFSKILIHIIGSHQTIEFLNEVIFIYFFLSFLFFFFFWLLLPFVPPSLCPSSPSGNYVVVKTYSLLNLTIACACETAMLNTHSH